MMPKILLRGKPDAAFQLTRPALREVQDLLTDAEAASRVQPHDPTMIALGTDALSA